MRLWHTVFEAVRCALEGNGQRGLPLLAHLGCTDGVPPAQQMREIYASGITALQIAIILHDLGCALNDIAGALR